MMLKFISEQLAYSIVVEDEVVDHFERHKQLNSADKEAGGQLFAIFDEGKTIIKKVTGPRLTDKRTRNSYVPDRRAEQKEIESLFAQGFHYVGDWHTHPIDCPTPSSTDSQNINAAVVASNHELSGFLMVVVGTADFPEGIRLSIFNGEDEHVLCPAHDLI